jgi:hypothetical protein
MQRMIGIQTGNLLNCVRWPLYALSDPRMWHALSRVIKRDLTGPSEGRKRVNLCISHVKIFVAYMVILSYSSNSVFIQHWMKVLDKSGGEWEKGAKSYFYLPGKVVEARSLSPTSTYCRGLYSVDLWSHAAIHFHSALLKRKENFTITLHSLTVPYSFRTMFPLVHCSFSFI